MSMRAEPRQLSPGAAHDSTRPLIPRSTPTLVRALSDRPRSMVRVGGATNRCQVRLFDQMSIAGLEPGDVERLAAVALRALRLGKFGGALELSGLRGLNVPVP